MCNFGKPPRKRNISSFKKWILVILFFLVSLRCDLLLKQKWRPRGLLSLQLIEISMIKATKKTMGVLNICWWALVLIHPGKWTWNTKMVDLEDDLPFQLGWLWGVQRLIFQGVPLPTPKKLVDFNLANEILESGNAVCVIFVWTVFLREFPPILGTVVVHRKDVHLEKVLLFVWKNWPILQRMFKTSWLPFEKTFSCSNKKMDRYF